jgi:hypothetical protein
MHIVYRSKAAMYILTITFINRGRSMSTYYFLPTRNVFGEGSVQEAGTLAKTLNVKKS